MGVKVNLKPMREKLGWSQEEVSRRVRCSRETYRAAERGGNVSLKFAIRLASIFETTVNGIWENIENIDPSDSRPDYEV